MKQKLRQRGITSIFVVIFASLLFSIIALSFAGLMNREQQRSSDDELSQSAYDSALAGVEDAKRVIMLAQNDNAQAAQAIARNECNTIRAAGLISGGDVEAEVPIQSSTTGLGSELNQAYTCVKVSLESPNYEVPLNQAMQSKLIPLYGASSFNTVEIEWQMAGDTTLPCGQDSVDFSVNRLCTLENWSSAENTPAMLRAQFILPNETITNLDALNSDNVGNTVFLYPSQRVDTTQSLNVLDRFVFDYNPSGSTSQHQPVAARCEPDVVSGDQTFQCRKRIQLGKTVARNSNFSMLRLSSLYKAAGTVRITLFNGSNRVDFNGVQPMVDSTGRANDLFRRVEARLSFASDVRYVENAVDTTGSLCKDFWVTRESSGQASSVDCTP